MAYQDGMDGIGRGGIGMELEFYWFLLFFLLV